MCFFADSVQKKNLNSSQKWASLASFVPFQKKFGASCQSLENNILSIALIVEPPQGVHYDFRWSNLELLQSSPPRGVCT